MFSRYRLGSVEQTTQMMRHNVVRETRRWLGNADGRHYLPHCVEYRCSNAAEPLISLALIQGVATGTDVGQVSPELRGLSDGVPCESLE